MRAFVVGVLVGGVLAGSALAEPPVRFGRDIRPILADACFKCHGPDAAARQAGLRLDDFSGATAKLASGSFAIVPGAPADSALLARVRADDPEKRMPPPETGKVISPEQARLLEAWIRGGAGYEPHWSFVPPTSRAAPVSDDVSGRGWCRNEIDRFILQGLESAGLIPNPEADRATLLRRVSLDLTGIPPTPEELDAFLADEDEDAYERAVDRLLASPRHGERMAMEWLDAARYADTNGYHIDNERYMWRWREWVIEAFNANMPFDRFTIEQLAGDLLPDATPAQKIASGFNRNHMINFEGGAIPEEYQTEYVLDRVNTTSSVWLGLTTQCARCHDHKYDPITMRDFYGMYAFFNNVPEVGLDGFTGNSKPFMKAGSPDQMAELDRLAAHVRGLEDALAGPMPEVDAAQAEWEVTARAGLAGRWAVLDPESVSSASGTPLAELEDHSVLASAPFAETDTFEIVATAPAGLSGGKIGALRVEVLADPALPAGGPGTFETNGNFVLTGIELDARAAGDGSIDAARIEWHSASASYNQPQYHVANAIDADPASGWAVDGSAGKDRIAVFVPREPFGFDNGTRLTIRLRHDSHNVRHLLGRVRLSVAGDSARAEYAASELGGWRALGPFRAATAEEAYAKDFGPEAAREGVIDPAIPAADGTAWADKPDFTDGAVVDLGRAENAATYLHRVIRASTPRVLKASFGSDDAFKVWINGSLVKEAYVARAAAPDQDTLAIPLRAGDNHLLIKVVNMSGQFAAYFDRREDSGAPHPLDVERLLAAEAPSADQARAIREYYRGAFSPAYARSRDEAAAAAKVRDAYDAMVPTTMVMEEQGEPRLTRMLARGQYDQPGDAVTPSVPAFLPGLAEGEKADRLAFARWLFAPENPLPARVAANRLWQMVFGVGIVETAEDFGLQGSWPSNQELLDWLAVEYRRSGWDTRHMLRLLVTSSAYRQASSVGSEQLERDPRNRLLGRGARGRLSAETIRDQALALGGLLNETIGGPSVRPYQPPKLWDEVSIEPEGDAPAFSAQRYKTDTGPALYRRGMYVFRKRSSPPPNLAIFDAPSRETCVIRRQRTNTPLQALAMMNDPVIVEASRMFGQRMALRGGSDGERIAWGFRAATGRVPDPREVEILRRLLESERGTFGRDPQAAIELLTVGEARRDDALAADEAAAWAMVASALLNLDESLTNH